MKRRLTDLSDKGESLWQKYTVTWRDLQWAAVDG